MTKPLNKVEKLIAELCPKGVEFKKLGEVAEIGTGSSNTNEGIEKGPYPFFVRSPIVRYKNSFEFDETAIITSGDGVGVGKIFHFVEGKYALHQRAYRIHIVGRRIKPKFFFFYMRNTFEKYILGSAVNSSVTSVRRPMLNQYPVPIPPLAIQQEIVKILDTFTTLEARKKQYEYYREELLTFGEDVEFKTLGELISLEYGKSLKENRRTGGEFPVLGSNGRVGFHNSYLVKGPCLVVGRKGSAGALVWEENNCYPIDTTFYVKIQNENLHLKYLYYKLKTLELSVKKQDGGVPGLNRNNIYKTKIPVPPLAEQERIVAILDKFEALVNDISVGLPAELNARRKQYEYYRSKLLTFKPLEKEYAKQ